MINQNRRSVIVTLSKYFDKILIYCVFNSSYNLKEIAFDEFASFEEIIFLNEKDIGNISKGFSERTAANGRIIFVLR